MFGTTGGYSFCFKVADNVPLKQPLRIHGDNHQVPGAAENLSLKQL